MKRTACGIGIICAVLAIAAGGFALSENQKKTLRTVKSRMNPRY